MKLIRLLGLAVLASAEFFEQRPETTDLLLKPEEEKKDEKPEEEKKDEKEDKPKKKVLHGVARRATIPKDLHGFLNPDDGVAISFWIVSMAMIASTAFFMWESMSIKHSWKTSMNVGSLVTLIAGVHYFYMREYWITVHMSPIVYRYIDWSLTVPLQMIEFYLILSAVKPDLGSGMFYRLLVGTVMMLLFGYLGEALVINPWYGFAVGMLGWFFILFEIFLGEGSSVASKAGEVTPAVRSAFGTMRFIVSVGWSIYPLGYFFGYLQGDVADKSLNCIYNLADFVNKIWFCLAIWHAARTETSEAIRNGTMKDPLIG